MRRFQAWLYGLEHSHMDVNQAPVRGTAPVPGQCDTCAIALGRSRRRRGRGELTTLSAVLTLCLRPGLWNKGAGLPRLTDLLAGGSG